MINEKLAKKYCRDEISKIENYEEAVNDKTQTWELHHRLELTLDGEFALSVADLKMHDMYYKRPYYELIFLTPAEHRSIHQKGKHLSEETKRKMSISKKGKTISDEHRIRISKANKGRKFTEEHRRNISESKKGKKNPNYEKKFSEETKRKMSEALKGHAVSEETKRKMSEALKGKNTWSKGKHHSEESKRKMSESHKIRWAIRKASN